MSTNDQAAFSLQYRRDARLRTLGATPDAAYRAWAAQRAVSSPVTSTKAGGYTHNWRGPWKKDEVLRMTPRSAWIALRDTSLPPWRADLSWRRLPRS